jgi:signal transduction histidine kinase
VDGQRVIGGYANVDFADLVATAEIPRSAANLASRKLLSRMILVAVVLVGLAVVMGFFWAHRIARPVENLALATRMIGKGQFDVHVAPETNDEIGSLAGSFNQMTAELQHRDKALQDAQAKLVQSEKMAAFGQIGAGIAHEVKNPLAGILASAQISKMEVDPDTQVYKDLGLIEKETKRCKTIIDNLLKFARQEKAIKTTVRVNAVIEDAIAIVNHQLELNKVTLEMQLEPDLPPVHGNPNQLQQVFMNLMINAQQAMEGKSGSLTVSSRRAADNIEIVFVDTGPGISEEARQKLFEPFFTTKSAGKGTGLGLSVSFGLIEDHGGEVTVESEVGQGATFIVSLPAFQKDSDPLSQEKPELVGSI